MQVTVLADDAAAAKADTNRQENVAVKSVPVFVLALEEPELWKLNSQERSQFVAVNSLAMALRQRKTALNSLGS